MKMGITQMLFFVGILVAIAVSIFAEISTSFPSVWWILATLGLIIGITHITKKEAQGFMIAVIALTISTAFLKLLPWVGGFLETLVNNLLSFFLPMAFIVAIVEVWHRAKNR